MAVIKFGSVVTSGRGSLGGSTIQPCHSGHIWRNKPTPTKSRTQAQSIIRGYNKVMQAGWRSLSDQDRKVWNDYAREKPVFNRTGEKHPLSGHSLWMKYQFNYLSNGLPFLTTPFNYRDDPFGLEIVKNGSFDNYDYWTVPVEFNISGGKLNYLATANNPVRQTLTLDFNDYYKFEFDISNALTYARIVFLRQTDWSICVTSPLLDTFIFPNGHVKSIVRCIRQTARLLIYCNTTGSAFSLDNFSIKKAYI